MDSRRTLPRLAVLAAGILAMTLLADPAGARTQGFRWVDDEGVVHYAGSLDEVPESLRAQFQKPAPGRPVPKVSTPPAPSAAPTPPPDVPRPAPAMLPSPAASSAPGPGASGRRGWWIVVTPEGWFRTITEEQCRRIADSATQRFRRTFRCVFESYD